MVTNKILCKTYLKESLGNRDGSGLMLLVSTSLEKKARVLVKILKLNLHVEPCEGFPVGYWVIF